MIAQIGYDKKDSVYFVYEDDGLRPVLFNGTYTQCLIIVGGLFRGEPLQKLIELAKTVKEESKMIIYLKVPWLDGTDADYLKFLHLESAVKYIVEEGIEEFVMSTEVMDIPEDDYDIHK